MTKKSDTPTIRFKGFNALPAGRHLGTGVLMFYFVMTEVYIKEKYLKSGGGREWLKKNVVCAI